MLSYLIFVLAAVGVAGWIIAGNYPLAAACFVGAIVLSVVVEYAQALRELRKAAPAPKAHAVTAVRQAEEYAIAGTAQYQDAIIALCEETAEYGLSKSEIIDAGMDGERIYRYAIQSGIDDNVQLIPEPENPHDPKAIRVELAGAQVGYIKRGDTSKIHELLASDGVGHMVLDAVGGPYKRLTEGEEGKARWRQTRTLSSASAYGSLGRAELVGQLQDLLPVGSVQQGELLQDLILHFFGRHCFTLLSNKRLMF